MTHRITLEPGWSAALQSCFASDTMAKLMAFLRTEQEDGKRIFPPEAHWFRALALTPLDQVRVVILGQDPYHGAGQAHGLSFSVPSGVRIPPSLRNIYKELAADLGIVPPPHGCLEPWARQGVLLLNAVLTVEMGKAASHQRKGWESVTDAIIAHVNARAQPVVFMLWGNYAQKKAAFVDGNRHLVLTAAHPSPLSAYNGFFGCQHFSKANAWLEAQGQPGVDWALPDAD